MHLLNKRMTGIIMKYLITEDDSVLIVFIEYIATGKKLIIAPQHKEPDKYTAGNSSLNRKPADFGLDFLKEKNTN